MACDQISTKRVKPTTRKSFKDSQEAIIRRLIRNTVRKAELTKSERDIILALVNHWFHHRGTGKPIHPGRAKLARLAGVTEKTVSRTLGKLRAASVITPLSNLNGGYRTATKYHLNIDALMTLCGADWLDTFRRFSVGNVPVVIGEMSRLRRDKMSHGIKGRSNPLFSDTFGTVEKSRHDSVDGSDA